MTLLAASAAMLVSVVLLVRAGIERFARGVARYEERAVAETGEALDELFLPISPDQVAFLHVLAVIVPFALGLLLTRRLVAALLLGGVGFFAPRAVVARLKVRRVAAFERQLLDVLPALSNGLRSGLSLVQALEESAREARPPFSQEVRLLLREVSLGRDLDAALERTAGRVGSEDFALVSTAIVTARRLGGNLAMVFDRIASTLRQRNALQGKVRALTAQGRLQGILLGSLPLVLGGALWFIDRHMIEVLFTDPIGWAILGAAAALEGCGAFFIRKIARIEV